MASICLNHVAKHYAGVAAVRDLTLDAAAGELLVLLGPSGAGKSTTLRLIAGLETPTAGSILIDQADVTRLPPHQRDLAMVFQDHTLYPHLTVRQNLEFGLRLRRTPAALMTERVARAADRLGIAGLLERRPAQLSGGERQRVALGRALVRQPKAFLLDEPFAHLDPPLRHELRGELRRLQQQLGITLIHVTHDQEEALVLADRIAVLNQGRLEQAGTPRQVYDQPANVFVAGFVGQPAMNFLAGRLQESDGITYFRAAQFQLPLPAIGAVAREVLLGIRPQDVRIAAAGQADFTAPVEGVHVLGSAQIVHLVLDDSASPVRWSAVVPSDASITVGAQVGGTLRRSGLHVFDRKTGQRLI